jgi:hypothetical protein
LIAAFVGELKKIGWNSARLPGEANRFEQASWVNATHRPPRAVASFVDNPSLSRVRRERPHGQGRLVIDRHLMRT